MEPKLIRALLIEAESDAPSSLTQLLQETPEYLEVVPVSQLENARREIERGGFDVLLVDLALPAGAGDPALSEWIALAPDLPAIIFSDRPDQVLALDALWSGAQDYLVKQDLDLQTIVRAIQFAIGRVHFRRGLLVNLERQSALLDAVPDMLLRIHRDGTYLDYKEATDFPPLVPAEEIIGKNLRQVMPPGVAKAAMRHIEKALSSGKPQVFEYQLAAEGEPRYFEARLVVNGEDEVLAVVRDVTVRKKGDEALYRYAERLRILGAIDKAILEVQSPEAIVKATLRHIQRLVPCQQGSIAIFDLNARSVTVFATHTSQKTPRGTGTLMSYESFAGLEALRKGEVHVVADLQETTQPSPDELEMREEGVCAYLRAPLIARDELIGALSLESFHPGVFTSEHSTIAAEVADSLAIAIRQARLFSQVQHLAITDELTGIYNRRHFFTLARREFERVRRYGGKLSAIMLDVDNFKSVNDTFGHATGDRVLRQVAQLLDQSVRETDILGRYGGDEFVILLPETDFVSAHQLAERLRNWIGLSPVATDRGPLQLSISMGVASLNEQVTSLAALIDLADTDMYAARDTS